MTRVGALPVLPLARTASCCSWPRSASSGRTSPTASAAPSCTTRTRARSTPTTRAATSRCAASWRRSSPRARRRSGSQFGLEVNTPIAPVNDSKSITRDPQFQARLPFRPWQEHGTDLMPSPIKLLGEQLPVPGKAAVEPGRDTDAVLASVLGYDAAAHSDAARHRRFGLARAEGCAWNSPRRRARATLDHRWRRSGHRPEMESHGGRSRSAAQPGPICSSRGLVATPPMERSAHEPFSKSSAAHGSSLGRRLRCASISFPLPTACSFFSCSTRCVRSPPPRCGAFWKVSSAGRIARLFVPSSGSRWRPPRSGRSIARSCPTAPRSPSRFSVRESASWSAPTCG